MLLSPVTVNCLWAMAQVATVMTVVMTPALILHHQRARG